MPTSREAPKDSARRLHPYLHPYLLDSVYLGLLAFSVPYFIARGRSRQLRDHIPRRFRDFPARAGNKPCLWIHGVSVGEILSARQLLRRFADEFPDWEFVISTTTRAGLEAGRLHYPDAMVISYPFDFSYLVKRAFDRVRPDLILIVEHELWPNFLWHAQARKVPVAIVNGRLSERSLRGYRWLSRVDTWPPPGVVAICAQDEASATAFRKLGVPSDCIRVTGNLKFDNIPERSAGVRKEMGLADEEWVLMGSSTHDGEEEILLDSFESLRREDDQSRLVIAPRRIERVMQISEAVARRGMKPVRWSHRWNGGGNGKHPAPQRNGHAEVLIIDTLGELDRLLAAGDVVFVGGSLVPFGGHNMIAPAGLGCPVVIGPHYQNFRSVVSALLEREALVIAKDAGDFSRKLLELKANPARAALIARRALETVADHAGASERTLDVLRPLIASPCRVPVSTRQLEG